MFTGIIERTARLASREAHPAGGVRLRVDRPPAGAGWDALEIGESIAVDGCCLTLVDVAAETLAFDVIAETIRRTNLGSRPAGVRLDLERSLRLGDRLGGHLVTGHIDGTGAVAEVRAVSGETRLTVEIPPGVPVRVVEKGSIAIDGVSLTIAAIAGPRFTVALIPHTLAVTNLAERRAGDRVNLEMDPIGRWVAALLAERGVPGGTR